MGMFGGIGGAISTAAKQTAKTVQRTGKKASVATGEVFRAGALGPLEYTTVKPLEWVAPKVIDLAQRGRGLTAQASELQGIAQATVAENPGLFSALGMGDLAGLLGGAAPASNGTFTGPTAPANAVPVWVWLAAAGAAVLGLVLILRRKA